MADDGQATAQRVWVVDDDRAVRFVLCTALRDAGYAVEGFDGAAAALDMLASQPPPDLLFTDVRMPGDDGLVLLDKLKAAHPQLPVIVMSAYTDVASTAGAFRGGAQEFLSKPFELDDAVALAQRVLPEPDTTLVEPSPPSVEPAPDQRPQLVGDTPAMRALFRAIGRLAQAPLSVLINGETGTGKELVAHALHHESPRVQGPFVALNTAAIPSELLESELFGHEAGAFTGAQRLQRGAGPRTRVHGDPSQWESMLSTWARQRLAEGAEGLHAQVRDRVDQALLEAALQITHGRRAEAAARLGMGRNTLTRKLGAGRRRGG